LFVIVVLAAMAEEEPPPPPEPVPVLEQEDFETRVPLFDEIFIDCKADAAKLASINERKSLFTAPPAEEGEENQGADEEAQKKGKTLMYGEVSINTLHKLLNCVKQQALPLFPGEGYFVDLGSGAGKTCVAAALLHPFEKVVGIECLQCLNDMATAALAKYGEAALPEGVAKPEVTFSKGDFLADFEGTCDPVVEKTAVAFAHATAFGEEQMKALERYAEKMPDKSYFITIGQALPDSTTFGENRHPLQRTAVLVKEALGKRGCDPSTTEVPALPQYDEVGWVEVHTEEIELAWGPSKAFVYKKIPGPFTKGWANGNGPWEQLVGLDKDEASTKLTEAREGLTIELIEKTGEPLPTEEEPNESRVRIVFDPETNLVCEAPAIG